MGLWVMVLAAAAGSVCAATDTPAAVRAVQPFFPFCIDWHDAKKRSFSEQASMLKELGYGGVGHIWLDKVEERIKSLDEAGLKLYQITMQVSLATNKPPYEVERFKHVLTLVKGRNVQFLLIVNGSKPSDASEDERAVSRVREMSDLARESGSQLLLYPHTSDWIETIEDAVRVAQKVDRPNVGVMFNLCHWLRVCQDRDYKTRLQQALPYLWAVSINGADERDEQPGWKRYIQPLDSGTFDLAAFLKTLRALGYTGPVGLQCFGIGGDAREHLTRSLAAWKKLIGELQP
jgi:sugar phosphate isomerase/epimerase